MGLKLEIVIEKLDGDIIVPVKGDFLQFRIDGVLLHNELHLWEEIMFIQITNRGLLDELKKNRGKQGE